MQNTRKWLSEQNIKIAPLPKYQHRITRVDILKSAAKVIPQNMKFWRRCMFCIVWWSIFKTLKMTAKAGVLEKRRYSHYFVILCNLDTHKNCDLRARTGEEENKEHKMLISVFYILVLCQLLIQICWFENLQPVTWRNPSIAARPCLISMISYLEKIVHLWKMREI